MFKPILAEILGASWASIPITSSISAATRSGSALGRSILLITGNTSRLWSRARYTSVSYTHLSDTLSRDKAETAVFLSQLLRNLHHIPAHDNRQFLMRAFIIDIKLDISKIHYMELDWSRVSGYELRQVYHLLFGSLTCIRRSMEVSGFYRHPPLRNHISCLLYTSRCV